MRRLAAVFLCCFLLGACSKGASSESYIYAAASGAAQLHTLSPEEQAEAANSDVIEIREKLFIAQTNDIYLNVDDYLGKAIRYQGIFIKHWDEYLQEDILYVIRYGPGCCGYDGEAGFEVAWDGELPQHESWVEACGVLEEYDMNGWPVLRLQLSELTVKEGERGEEYVWQ